MVGGADESLSETLRAALAELEQRPHEPRLHFRIGELWLKQSVPEKAIQAFQTVISLAPKVAVAHFNLGNAYFAAKQYEQAVSAYQRACQLDPDADGFNNLGTALAALFQWDLAREAFQQAIAYNPNLGRAHANLARVLNALHQPEAALSTIDRAIELAPDHPSLHLNRGEILQSLNQITESVASFLTALEQSPGNPRIYDRLGELNRARGLLSEAFFCYLESLRNDPRQPITHSHWLLTMLYDDGADASVLLQEARRWASMHASHEPVRVHAGAATSDRKKLRLGYLSAHFNDHPVGRSLLPVLRSHDPQAFDLFVYQTHMTLDSVTAALQAQATHWNSVASLSDEELVAKIRLDEIDILIDLDGHTDSHRLNVFAMKPAATQLTWFGFPGTTGLSQIDYIVGDKITLPSDASDHYSEKPMRLAHSFICFEAPESVPQVSPLPFDRRKFLTFGSCNDLAKITPAVIRLWSEILRAIPDSRLILDTWALADQGVALQVLSAFDSNGVSKERLELRSSPKNQASYGTYSDIDIALDPFPFDGGITTAEALWMGVPVLCLRGQRFAGLRTTSLLHLLGLDAWIASSPTEYVQIAERAAEDKDELKTLRNRLRELMRQSPLCDVAGFTRNFETLLRTTSRTYES